jgi:hypothetical protein
MGFAIPVELMFHGPVVWRGMVYTVLMVLGKCVTSVWLLILPPLTRSISEFKKRQSRDKSEKTVAQDPPRPIRAATQSSEATIFPLVAVGSSTDRNPGPDPEDEISDKETRRLSSVVETKPTYRHSTLFAALLLSFAMTTRGEIGFLVAAVGQSITVLDPEDVYLVVIWAVVLCTLLGSIGVGIIVYIIKKVANGKEVHNLLGKWG